MHKHAGLQTHTQANIKNQAFKATHGKVHTHKNVLKPKTTATTPNHTHTPTGYNCLWKSECREKRREREWRSKNTLSACLSLWSDRRATVYSLHRQPDSQCWRPCSPSSLPSIASGWGVRERMGEGGMKRRREGGRQPSCLSLRFN